MKEQDRKKRTVTGEKGSLMAQALDRQDVPYRKCEDGIEVLMTESEFAEALEDAQCEQEMQDLNYRVCIVSLKTHCSPEKLDKIMKSLNKKTYTIMEKDVAAFERMIKNDI